MKTTVERGEPREIHLAQRHGRPPLALTPLRGVVRQLLQHLKLRHYRLGIHFVGTRQMSRLNETFLRHAGPTDVIAFDYQPDTPEFDLHGEIFVCVPETLKQARRYRAQAQDELVRTVVHGVLHLRGYEDGTPSKRRAMKLAENRWLRRLRRELALDTILSGTAGSKSSKSQAPYGS